MRRSTLIWAAVAAALGASRAVGGVECADFLICNSSSDEVRAGDGQAGGFEKVLPHSRVGGPARDVPATATSSSM